MLWWIGSADLAAASPVRDLKRSAAPVASSASVFGYANPSPLPRDGQRQREAEAGAARWRSARSRVQDIVRLENGKVAEHWDVIQDEVREASRSGLPMFGGKFPA
jgi:hypothetical protein